MATPQRVSGKITRINLLTLKVRLPVSSTVIQTVAHRHARGCLPSDSRYICSVNHHIEQTKLDFWLQNKALPQKTKIINK